MDQKDLNQIAAAFIKSESMKVATKLVEKLQDDITERKERISEEALRHIHTLSLFELLAIISLSRSPDKEISKEAARAYSKLVESLKPKYLQIAEELKDFRFDKN